MTKLAHYAVGAVAMALGVSAFCELVNMEYPLTLAFGGIIGMLYGIWYVMCYGIPWDDLHD